MVNNFLFEDNSVLPRLISVRVLYGLATDDFFKVHSFRSGQNVNLQLAFSRVVWHVAFNNENVNGVVGLKLEFLNIRDVKGLHFIKL